MTDRDLMQQALDALELACEIADRVPNRWHETEAPGTAAYDIGVAINQRNLSGECGYHVLNDAASALRARLAEPVQPVAQWQPIETAPRDSTSFLGWVSAVRYSSEDGGGSGREHDESTVDFCWYRPERPDETGGYFTNASGQIGDAQDITHWMPLPAAPGAAPTVEPVVAPEGYVTLYECVGCGHLYQQIVSQCDCMENNDNVYREWIAAPKGAA